MPKYKLTYFGIRGLAEPIRMMLSYMKQDFEDVRVTKEQWPSIKPKMPFGKVPVLEIDGKIIHQSTCITRYLGKQVNLAGRNDWESLQIDIVIDTLHDLRTILAGYAYETNEAEKESKKRTVINETTPYYLQKFDDLVKNNGGYLANGALSWADIYFIGASDYINFMYGINMFDKYKNLKSLRDKIWSLPGISEYIEKRPASEM